MSNIELHKYLDILCGSNNTYNETCIDICILTCLNILDIVAGIFGGTGGLLLTILICINIICITSCVCSKKSESEFESASYLKYCL